jgi:hypothetical protein
LRVDDALRADAAFDRDDRPDDLLVGIVRLSSS